MKTTVLQENLAKKITLASKFVSSRTQLPILGNILLKASKTKLLIASTNLEISVATSIGAKTEKEGEIAIPSKVIAELVPNLSRENVIFSVDKEQLKIVSTGFSSTVLGMNTSDFPKIPVGVDTSKSIKISQDVIAGSLSHVLFSVSTDETRPILTGVLFSFSKNALTLVATDGFRLSLINVPGISFNSQQSFVIPKAILSEIVRVEEDTEILFEFKEKEKQIMFGVGDTVYSSRLLEGTYPDYEKIIPKTSKIKVRLDKDELLRAVKLASIFARDNANIVRLRIKKEEIVIIAESSTVGSQEAKIDAKIESGDQNLESGSFEIAFNYKFLEDFINSVAGEDLTMEFSDVDKPGVFLDPAVSGYLHLIMPVKIQS